MSATGHDRTTSPPHAATSPSPLASAAPRHARVAFVGAGPGDPGLLTVRGSQLLATADALVIDAGVPRGVVAAHQRADATIVEAGFGDEGVALTRASRAKLLVRTAKATTGTSAVGGSGGGAPNPGDAANGRVTRGLVVRVMAGDPGTFNGLATELAACHKAGLEVEVVPGVSTVHAAPAYAGVPLSSDKSPTILTSCGDPARADWTGAAGVAVTVVIVGDAAQVAAGLARVVAVGRDPQTPVALTQDPTTTTQRTVTTTLEHARGLIEDGTIAPALAVVGSTVGSRHELSWFETRPLFGWRVLVPRTKDQAGDTLARLAIYGAHGEVVPTISVEPPRTPQQMRRAIKGLVTGRYEWVGFTSVNAVRAVKDKLAEIGLDVRAFAGLKIAAVGGVTAQALRDWGLEPDLVPAGEESARGLLEVWPPFDDVLDPINGVFLPRADIATETLVAGLQGMGWEVDDVTAYRTVRAAPPPAPTREAIKSGAFDAVVFTSSSTVRNLVGIAGKPNPSTVVACIGPATAKTAQEHGLTVSVIAERASGDALVDALAGYGRSLREQAQANGEDVQRPSQARGTGRRKAR
ncbi:MAG: uroporphyrinogen-III synthase [Micrococcales bacterium]|nr:uroporphyrinogen-III synthase [Micrococcales bacterium]